MASISQLGSERRRGAIPRGFTLIELMVAIMVLGILLGVAVPSFRDAALSSRLTAYANDLVASAQIARSEAIKRNAPVTLCASEDGAACEEDGGWEVGWVVLTEDGVVLQRQQPLSDEFRFTETSGGLTEITFPATVSPTSSLAGGVAGSLQREEDEARRLDCISPVNGGIHDSKSLSNLPNGAGRGRNL
mgnify:CR=1 FL=1